MYEDPIIALEAETQRAEDLSRRGDLAGAHEVYRALVRRRVSALEVGNPLDNGMLKADAVIIQRLAELTVMLGNRQAADDLFHSLGDKYDEKGVRYEADYVTLTRIYLALEYGLLHSAQKLLGTLNPSIGPVAAIDLTPAGLEAWERTRCWSGMSKDKKTVLCSRLYLVMGRLLATLGQYDDAQAVLERGLLHTGPNAPGPARQANVVMQIALAEALLEKGAFAPARDRLQILASNLDEQRDPGLYLRALEIQGKLHLLSGEFAEALRWAWYVFDLTRERRLYHAVLRAALNLSHVLIYLNQTSTAQKILNGVQPAARILDDAASAFRATSLLQVARARSESLAGHLGLTVSEMLKRSRSRAPQRRQTDRDDPRDQPQPANFLAFFEEHALAFQGYLGQADFEQASESLALLFEVFESTDSSLIHVRLRILDAMLAYYQGRLPEAEAAFKEVSPFLEHWGLKPELWQALRFLGWCLARFHPQEYYAVIEQASSLLDDLAESLPGPERAMYLLNKWTMEEERLGAEIDQLVIVKAALRGSPWYRRLRLRWTLMKRLDALLARIDRHKDMVAGQALEDEDTRGEQTPKPSLWRQLLKPSFRRASLSFLVLPDRVLIICSRWLHLDFELSRVGRLRVRNLVRNWHESARGEADPRDLSIWGQTEGAADARDLPAWNETRQEPYPDETRKTVRDLDGDEIESVPDETRKKIAAELAKALPLSTLLKRLPARICALTVAPDDVLHGFPFAAIVHEDQYLIERYALSVAFQSQSRRASTQQPSTNTETLLVGVAQGAGGYGQLLGVPSELDLIEKRLTHRFQSVYRMDEKAGGPATKERVLDHLPHAWLFHIACHGTFEPDRPSESGFVLIPNPGHIEVLSLRDLTHLNLEGLRHVTFSSCWAADNFILPGRWIISLPETLWRAGAQSILGCLWPVYDGVAAAFMDRFYAYLDEGKPRDEALQRTQLDCLNNKLAGCGHEEETANPIFWAGFNLYGDPRPLML